VIYDTEDNPLSSGDLSLGSEESRQITIKIDCGPGLILRAEAAADLSIQGRQADEVSSSDLVAGGLDLTSWQGSREIFIIDITAGEVLTIQERSFALTVGL
jgi:hypothetical protein